MNHRSSRRQFLGAAGMVAVAGCTRLGGGGGDVSESTPPLSEFNVPLAYTLTDLFEESVGSGRNPDDPPAVGRSDVAIDEPSFHSAADANLAGTDLVFGIEKNGETKAYPQHILVWNEIVNDVVGGDPVCVTYCPLTGTAVGFDRGEASFGLSNKLVNSNLILYDRGTETWWPQMLGAGIANENRGQALIETQVVWTTWNRWRQKHPDTTVLTEETGFIRDYGDDPYGSYDPEPGGYYASSEPTRVVMHEDDRFHSKEVVVGARTSDGTVAFVKETMRQSGVETERVGETSYSAFYDDCLDVVYVYRNPDSETFTQENGLYADSHGESFRADNIPLEAVIAFDAMWFAWVAFFPNTVVAPAQTTFFEAPGF